MSFSKHILILGAGFMQKPAIESALHFGWHVTVVDGNKNAVCAPLAHRFEHIDLKDITALEKLALSMKNADGLDAVFTAGTDFSSAVSYLSEKCGISFAHSYNAACNATNKVRMRRCFAEHGVPSPLYREADSAFASQMSASLASGKESVVDLAGFSSVYPLVVKPADNMGARGCRMVHSGHELLEAVQTAIPYSRTGKAIIEEYMDGAEFSLDSLVYGEKIIITGFADRHIFYPPYFIEMGHTMSTSLSLDKMKLVADVFARGVRALGLTHGVAKGDMKLTKSGAMIGEIAARLSGGYMSGWTFPYASGINLTEQALLLASGSVPNLFEEENLRRFIKLSDSVWYIEPASFSAERAWISIPGVVNTIYGYKDAGAKPFVKDIFPRSEKGSVVSFPVNNVEKCGNCITCADTRAQAVDAAETAVSCITLRLEPNRAETKAFLEQSLQTEFPPSAFSVAPKDAEDALACGSCGRDSGTGSIADSLVFDSSVPWQKQLPPSLEKYLEAKDWNHLSMRNVLEKFCEMCPAVQISAPVFWQYLLRGSLQGILFAADSKSGSAQ